MLQESLIEVPDVRLLHSITLQNILSFGPNTPSFELRALNVIIGPNGSGKSNLIDSIGLLQSAPEKLGEAIRTEGSVRDWLWKGSKKPTARVEAVVAYGQRTPLRHWFEFRENGTRFELSNERIEAAKTTVGFPKPFFYFGYENGHPLLSVNGKERGLKRETIDPDLSILPQRRDPESYPELTYLGDIYKKIRIYREWTFGRTNKARDWQATTSPADYLTPLADNLALMLSRLRRDYSVKQQLLTTMDALYAGIVDVDVDIDGGRSQVYIQEEGGFRIPAGRLSDGTLRFLNLLVILLHPEPPPLICIEEPELGLHTDAIVAIGKLIKDASTRTQLIVTTHSDVLLDTWQDSPEDVIVANKIDGCTSLNRLIPDEVNPFLETYSLSELRSSGEIGANRWSN